MAYPAPSTDNYYIGKGRVEFLLDGESDWLDLGNVPTFEFTPTIEKLDHFSSRTGTRTKDRSVTLERSATVRIVMEEFSAHRLRLALLGSTPAEGSGGDYSFSIFSVGQLDGAIRFTGANDVGPRLSMYLPNVSLVPSGSIGFIFDEFGQMEMTGEVTAENDGTFGTVNVTPEA